MSWQDNLSLFFRVVPIEFLNTLYMVAVSTLLSFLIGLPLGVLLYTTAPHGLKEKPWLYKTLELLVNIGRSIPFAILIIAIFPLTRFLVGTSIGTTASIVPLTLASIPFMARVMEQAFQKIEPPLIEAALVMGSTTRQIVSKVLLAEALPSIVSGVTLTAVNLIGLSAMAGLVGGGGLGKVAIQYGYQRFNGFLMLSTLILLVLLVMGVQTMGNQVTKEILRKRRS